MADKMAEKRAEHEEFAVWQVLLVIIAGAALVMLASPSALRYLSHVRYETDKQWVREVCSVMASALGDAYVDRPSGDAGKDGWVSITVLNNGKKAVEEDERYRSFDHEVLKNLEEDEGHKVQSRLQTEGADELYFRIAEDYLRVEVKAAGKGNAPLPEGIVLEAALEVRAD